MNVNATRYNIYYRLNIAQSDRIALLQLVTIVLGRGPVVPSFLHGNLVLCIAYYYIYRKVRLALRPNNEISNNQIQYLDLIIKIS